MGRAIRCCLQLREASDEQFPTGDNFFIVKDGALYTAEPRNILRGISREYVMELSEELGIPCFEKNMDVYDVANADEAFMTGTRALVRKIFLK